MVSQPFPSPEDNPCEVDPRTLLEVADGSRTSIAGVWVTAKAFQDPPPGMKRPGCREGMETLPSTRLVGEPRPLHHGWTPGTGCPGACTWRLQPQNWELSTPAA